MIPLDTGGGYTPPTFDDFKFDGLFGTDWLNKPMLQLIIAAALVLIVWLLASRKLNVIPGKFQWFMEYAYDFVRDGIGRDVLGPGFRPYIGLLVGIFSFVLVNNWFGEFFLFMFPTFSNIGYTWGVVALMWLIYVGAGFKEHGIGYLRNSLIPSGVPWYLWFIIVPIEFLSNFITRPLTLAVRLFANMFAGHITLMIFVIGGAYLLTQADSILYNAAGVAAIILSLAMMCLELLIGFLQAYIFTILTAQYISTSISSHH